jgi:hypothetical protein
MSRDEPEKTIVMHENGAIVSISKEGTREIIVRLSYGSKALNKQIYEFIRDGYKNDHEKK